MADGSVHLPEKPKHPGGRPTLFREEYCSAVIDLGSQGYSKARMAAHFGVAKQTVDEWAKQFPQFLDALARARTLSQAWWEQEAQTGLKNRDFNAGIWDKSVKSMFREDYQDRSTLEHVGKDGEAIEIKDSSIDARRVAFMLGRAVGRAQKAATEKSDS